MSAETRYRQALERHGIADLQPLYRKMLVRLKSSDPDSYRTAVTRYEETVAPGGGADPLELWVRYGRWLADRIQPGQLTAVDRTGWAEPVTGDPPLGPLLLHLPDQPRVPALAIAVPESPSPSQSATLELLCT